MSSTYYAIADQWHAGTYTLRIIQRADEHEVWGDQPLSAARWVDIPDAATERLQAPVPYRVAGEWRSEGDAWIADAEIA